MICKVCLLLFYRPIKSYAAQWHVYSCGTDTGFTTHSFLFLIIATYVCVAIVCVPQVGLGTGGIYREHTAEVLSEALSMGYRLLDLAREYGNEGITGQVLHRWRQQQQGIHRAEVFIQSKVWPTQLGFLATQRALTASLQELRSTYIDMYMLHWSR